MKLRSKLPVLLAVVAVVGVYVVYNRQQGGLAMARPGGDPGNAAKAKPPPGAAVPGAAVHAAEQLGAGADVVPSAVAHAAALQEKTKAKAVPFVDNSADTHVYGTVVLRSAVPLKPATPKRMHGILGQTQDGTPGWEAKPWPVGYAESASDKTLHHAHTCFNLFKSDTITLDRDVPDARDGQCRQKVYPADLPTTSVVFVFYNEPLSPLYRSIHSVLNRTPRHLLKEIILIDDGSDAEWLQKPLEDYLKLLPKVVLKRMQSRQGLMATRTEGAREASGDVVTFLDSHIEVNQGWVEPLLARIKEDRRHVVMPIIDSIDPDSLQYRMGGLDILGFSWSLGQKGTSRRRSRFEPMPSPVMAGGLFSIDRALFFELGAYDPEMKLYGGEEMEISFRLWQCGNTLECIPCSRVGHIFRTGKYWKGQVYPVPGHVIIRNKLRAAYMWMDEYAEIAHNVMGNLPKGNTIGDLSWGKLRKTCLNGGPSRPFKWYLENVYPEMTDVLSMSRTGSSGEIRNPKTGGCVDTMGHHSYGGQVGLYPCHGSHGTQEFLFSSDGQMRVALMDFSSCLSFDTVGKFVTISKCSGKGWGASSATFSYDDNTGALQDADAKKCLTASSESHDSSPLSVYMEACTDANTFQEWRFKAETPAKE